ncbi:tetratricopeptide repeat protein [Saccharopolyspora phatthalungensis]|uniref:Tfp pilus assembly protein PilF n=1 Tax=Saccharopolyspora phatthalungensis TaxID=664693 RepID=A0A840QC54_9PSEU|nr:tetratricopeptide repeat protein [Saccharopolyspora phatthalungensis]MBB5157360.1 Tfp pilus assembly protein PilF [Saccharopolyspora phatthalungensis]
MSPDDALTLLSAVAGRNWVREQREAAAAVADRCSRVPLALRAIGDRVAAHPQHSMVELAGELATDEGLLDTLEWHDPSVPGVRETISWSDKLLPSQPRQALRMLGPYRAEIDMRAAAAVMRWPLPHTRRVLERLLNEHLLTETTHQRYRMTDLVRAYATERALQDLPQHERDRAMQRWLDWYLHSAAAASRMLAPHRDLPALDACAPEVDALVVAPQDYHAALGWCARELPHLGHAIDRAHALGHHSTAWKLAVVYGTYLELRRPWQTWISVYSTATEIARVSQDRAGESWCLHHLGSAWAHLRNYDAALPALAEAIRLRAEIEDQQGLAWSRCVLGAMFLDMGRYSDGHEQFEQAWQTFTQVAPAYGTASALAGLGTAQQRLGNAEQARGRLTDALRLFDDAGARDGAALALLHLGETFHALRQPQRALDYVERGIRIRRELDDRSGIAECLHVRAQILHTSGDLDAARAAWTEALSLFDSLADPRASDVRSRLATVETTVQGY